MDLKTILELLKHYNKYCYTLKQINKELTVRKIRLPNFPSEISENIAKICFYKKYNDLPSWNTDKGDLILEDGRRIEVKGFSSRGPTSFGPTEKWDIIMFVDCIKAHKCHFKVYIAFLANDSKEWQALKVNKKQTFKDQCLQKRRPRLAFSRIQQQIKLTKIFDGPLQNDHDDIEGDGISDKFVKLTI